MHTNHRENGKKAASSIMTKRDEHHC